MHTAETGGTTVSVRHPSRVEGVKDLWTPHTARWLLKCWLINMTFWHDRHLRKPPVRRYTQACTVTTYVPTRGQHRSHAPGCGLPPVISTSPSPPPTDSQKSEGKDVKCGGYYLSWEPLIEEHVCAYGRSGWFTGRAVLTQFNNSPTTSLLISQPLTQILRSMSKTWQHGAQILSPSKLWQIKITGNIVNTHSLSFRVC